MSRLSKNDGRSITKEEMCVIETHADGTLQTVFYPTGFDLYILGQIQKVSGRMKIWEDSRRERLLESIRPMLDDVGRGQEWDVRSALAFFQNLIEDTYLLIEGDEADVPMGDSITVHDDWSDGDGIHSLSAYSRTIRGFGITHETVVACQYRMEEDAYSELEWAYHLAESMRPCLLNALGEYEAVFDAYVNKMKQIVPELFERKSFCRRFSATYGEAELDYTITPGNQCIVDRAGEYYWACVLERLYDVFERRNNVKAYSHRRRGFEDYTFDLERKCNLRLVLKTNFGYGSSSYFGSTLSYRGVSAVNAPYLIFFREARKIGFFNFTYRYALEESSFVTCFDDAVRIHNEYRQMGEARFVDKYFRKSLEDLSGLLRIVVNTDTFLQITTLERFYALTSKARSPLIPDEGFSSVSFALSADEKRAVDAIVSVALSVVNASGVNGCVSDPRIRAMVDQMLGQRKLSDLQLIVKKDLIRSRMVISLASSVPDVGDLVERLIPSDEEAFMVTYEGYDLVATRVEKADTVIGLIQRLRTIAALTDSQSSIDSIVSTCKQIAEQAQSYITQEIAPELGRKVSERNGLVAQLNAVEIEKAKYRGVVTWLEGQSQSLKTQIGKLNRAIYEFERRMHVLEDYMMKVCLL